MTSDWGPIGGATQGLPDAVGHIDTQTGKIEFESQSLKRFDPNDKERPPVAKYIPSWEGHHTRALYKKYPLHLISPHPAYSFHTMYDAKGCWMNEIPEHRVKAGRRALLLGHTHQPRMTPKREALKKVIS